MSPRPKLVDPVLGPLTIDRLTRDFEVFQRARGHRFSSDDVATAFVAAREAPGARRVLDLGTGLGSVLLHLAWIWPQAELVGVEAQAMSFDLLGRNVARNELGARVAIHHGDLRDEGVIAALGAGFDLVTGTPPYFPPSAALDAEDEQRAYARIEYRGGVEAYLTTAARLVAPAGTVVVAGDAHAHERVLAHAPGVGLALHARCDVIARADKPPLFSVWTLRRAPAEVAYASLTLRTAAGERTPDADRLRAFSGF